MGRCGRSNRAMADSLAWPLVRTPPQDWDVTVVKAAESEPPEVSLAELSEGELVQACLERRPGAFDLIVERHRRQVYQVCYRFVGNHEDASDLSQDVFLRAYRGLRSFKGGSTLATWLYRIAVNASLNRVSVKTPVSEPIEERQHVDSGQESAAEQVLRGERAAQVRAAVARLPKRQRTALVLRMYHDLSHQEIAGIVGSSVGAVKANVFHALRNLKKLLPAGMV